MLKVATAAALVLAAEAATALKADDANGGEGEGGVAVVSCASLAGGGGLIKLFDCLFVVNIIICTLLERNIVTHHGVSQSLLFSETRD